MKKKEKDTTNKYGTKVYNFFEKKWEKESFSLFPIAALFILLLMLVIIFSGLRGFIFPRLADIEIMEKERVEFKEEYKGLIVRDESVRYAPLSGRADKLIKDGTRVARGEPVLSYNNQEMGKEEREDDYFDYSLTDDNNNLKNSLESKLTEIDTKIQELRRNKIKTGDLKSGIRNAYAIKQAYDDINDEDTEESGDAKEDDTKEDDTIKSPKPGIVSFFYDGYENILKPEKILDFSVDELERFISKEYEGLSELSDGEIIFSGQSLFRIVDNYTWIMVLVMDQSELEKTVDGKSVAKFSLKEDDEWYHAGIIDYKFEKDKGALFLEVRRDLGEFWNDRTKDVSIVTETREGFEIPPQALVEKDGEEGVFLVKRGIVRFYPVEILFRKNDKIYIEGIEDGDNLIKNPRFIEDGDKVR
ncbi:HlyD family efflux transporter periplasmic adaptor subunit [Natranaerofaba carboxydovora]|uniref:HlyD family efflux transporter periplasmic adaptor subunit n=1 Tax=Natranaerofaba carboxydovora TaxID=2742683 RepID=UPI001F12DF02|nr:HlyD family efflux transporter periplasmic adaptor subunit [Natranaerofaba carboxydovora]UMZ73269.1 TIGR02828: putative membrane fusion protein [Natranaerofaba carboxydovora]